MSNQNVTLQPYDTMQHHNDMITMMHSTHQHNTGTQQANITMQIFQTQVRAGNLLKNASRNLIAHGVLLSCPSPSSKVGMSSWSLKTVGNNVPGQKPGNWGGGKRTATSGAFPVFKTLKSKVETLLRKKVMCLAGSSNGCHDACPLIGPRIACLVRRSLSASG